MRPRDRYSKTPITTEISGKGSRSLPLPTRQSHQLADGARYILDDWNGLTRFLDHPDDPPDNNAAENALRIHALIRKNSLFIGSHGRGPS
jgi:hypothetical protein